MKFFLKATAVCLTAGFGFLLWIGYLMAEDAAFVEETGRYD